MKHKTIISPLKPITPVEMFVIKNYLDELQKTEF